MPCQLEFLGRAAHSTHLGPARRKQARDHALRTLGALVAGGIHDHVGGGFARYSVDEAWHVPHFEKMLYDNAQLVSALSAWAHVNHPEFTEALTQTVAFMEREWRLDHGGFCAALDADSEGQEGHLLRVDEGRIDSILAPDEVACLDAAFGLNGHSLWQHDQHVLRRKAKSEVGSHELQGVLHKLQTWRDGANGRVKPGLDDKVLTSWNALAAVALAKAARRLPDCSLAPALRLGHLLAHHGTGAPPPRLAAKNPPRRWRPHARGIRRRLRVHRGGVP